MITSFCDLSAALNFFKSGKRRCPVYALLDFNVKYFFGGNEKCIDAAFAILYDFVDAFVIKGYSDLQETIDPLLTLRLYNDNYKPIYLEVENDILYEELDEIIAYSKLSNIDGLLVKNQRLEAYARKQSGNVLILLDTIQVAGCPYRSIFV